MCLVAGHGSLAAPQHGPPLPPTPPEQVPAFLKLLQAALRRHQGTEFTAPSSGLPLVETAAKVVPAVEAVAEVVPVVEAAEVVPAAEAEVIAVNPAARTRPHDIALLAEVAGPSAVRLSGPPAAALKSRDRPTAGPPTRAQAIQATSVPRPYSGYLPPAESPTGSSPPRPHSGYLPPAESTPDTSSKSVRKPSNSYLPPPPPEATGPSGEGGTKRDFSFTFDSPDGLIPPELLKDFTSTSKGPDGGTSHSTTSTWHTFQTYEFQHTAPGLGGTGSSQPGTGTSQSGVSGPTREITLDLPGNFPNIGAGLLGLAGLGGPAGRQTTGGSAGNLDQPAPGPDSLNPADPQFVKQIENALALDALALDNPELNAVEKEFRGATPVVSPAKVGEFIPDAVLFREHVEPANLKPASANPASQKIIPGESRPGEGHVVGATSPGNSGTSSTPTFGKGLRPSVQTGSRGSTGGGAEPTSFSGASPSNTSLRPHASTTIGAQGSPGSSNVFPFRRDGPPDSSFRGTSFGGQTTSRPFFGQSSFTTITPRPFTHTTPSTSRHGTFGQTRPPTGFHNSFSQTPSTDTRGTSSHTTPSVHSQGTFSQTRPATNFQHTPTQGGQTNSQQRPFHQSSPPVNTHSTFTQRPVTSAPGTPSHRPTRTFQTTFTQSTTHHRPFAQTTHGVNMQSTFSQTRPASHATFTPTIRPAIIFQSSFTQAPASSHQRPLTQNTQSSFTQTRPATNTQASFTHSRPNTNFQRTFGTTSPPTNQGTFRQVGPSPRPQQATFIQINPPNSHRGSTFRQTGNSATTRPRAGPQAPVTSVSRLPNYNDPNFDSYAFYSDLRNLYGTPK